MITILTQKVISTEYAIQLQSTTDLMNNAMDDKNVAGDKKPIESPTVPSDTE